jgi:hypothetical protein
MPAFTGPRLERYEELKVLRRFIGAEEYKKQVAKLEKAQKVIEKRAEQAEARREAKRVQREREAKIRREEKKAQRRADRTILARVVVPVGSAIDGPEVYAVAERIHTLSPREFRLRFYVNGVPYEHGDLFKESALYNDLRDARTRRIHEAIRHFYTWTYDGPSIFNVDWSGVEWPLSARLEVVISSSSQPLVPRRLRQAFADGAVHCVADPLAKMWEGYADNCESEEARKKALRTARQIRAFGAKYPNGIPEGKPMEEIARMARRHVVITDIFNNAVLEYNKRSTHKFYLFNARENHVEVGHICFGGKAQVVSKEEMEQIVAAHETRYAENGEFYMFEGINDNKRCVRSAYGAWRVADPLHDIYDEHNKENGISEYGFDAVRFPDVNHFLKRSALVNSVPVKLSDDVPTQHHDLKAAYTQHALTLRFEGFMGKVQQWRNVENMPIADVLKRLCICEFVVTENAHPLLLKLGLTVGSVQVLPSPEIKMFIEMGVSVRLVNAVFGSKTDINYGESIMTEKAYATWAGCLSHDKAKKEYNFRGSRAWACHLAHLYGRENVRFNHGENITVLVDKKHNFNKHHVLAFITSYTRINIIEALMKIKTPCAVVLDGIYHCDESAELPSAFRSKPLKTIEYYGEGWYADMGVTGVTFPPADVDLLSNCVLAGQGGCGKTHSILTDAGFNNVLYVVPQHMLGQGIGTKYGARYTTIHRLVGIECQPLKASEVAPAVCLIDEMTMIEASWIEKAIAMYPETLFFVAGDVARTAKGLMWFQCRNGKPGEFSDIWNGVGFGLKTYTHDRRSRDEELKTAKINLRVEMLRRFTDGGYSDAQRVADWIPKRIPL